MSLAEWGATIFSLIYLYYAIKNKPICFIFGIIGSAIWAFVVFDAHLIFDTVLQVFYIVMSIIGIYRWKFGGNNKAELPITKLSTKMHLGLIAFTLIITNLLYFGSQFIEVIDKPLLDAFTTILLVIGTILLIERKLYSWVYLVIADIGYLYIYGASGLWLLVGVMAIYCVFGTIGFLEWRKEMRNNTVE